MTELPPVRETEIGPMPAHWTVEPLGHLFHSQLGKMLSPAVRTGASPRPYLRNANVQWGYIDLSDLAEMDLDDDDYDRFGLLAGDVLVCEGGEVGRTALWRGERSQCYYQKALHRLRPRDARMDPEFFALHMLHAFRIQKSYGEVGTVATIANLPGVKLKTLPVPVPPVSEQRAIVRVLRTVERAKEACEQVIAATRQLKQSLLHHLFTYGPVPFDQADQLVLKQTEFGSAPASWQIRPLGDCAYVQTGVAKGRILNGDEVVELPYLRVANVQDGRLDLSEMKSIQIRKREVSRFLLLSGDVVLTEGGDFDELGRGFVWKSLRNCQGDTDSCLLPRCYQTQTNQGTRRSPSLIRVPRVLASLGA